MSTATLIKPQTSTAATTSPKGLCTKHSQEWLDGSGVNRTIALQSAYSEFDNKKIADFLGWKDYFGPGGYIIPSIDPLTGEHREGGQFKPDTPYDFGDGSKPAKYITSKKNARNAIFLGGLDPDFIKQVIGDININVFLGEGAKKAATGITHGLFTIALTGVEMGLINGELIADLLLFAQPGRKFYLAFDADIVRKPAVRKALKKLAKKLIEQGCKVYIITWDESDGKGMDDYIVKNTIVAFNRRIDEALPFDEYDAQNKDASEKSKSTSKADDKPGEKPPLQHYAAEIVEEEKNTLLWNSDIESWTKYREESTGVWTLLKWDVMEGIIAKKMDADPRFCKGYSPRDVKEVIDHLRHKLLVTKWKEAKPSEFIPFIDGVLEVKTQRLLPHSPDYRFTWTLPYKWMDSRIGCKPITDWLLKAVGDNKDRRQLLRAFLKATLTGRYDLHFFFELIGPGGSGKSTFGKTVQALIGPENSFTTNLRQLERNNFEVAGAYNKRLTIVPDSSRYAGEVSVLRSMTGGDALRYEQKYQKTGRSFIYQGTVLLIGNAAIQMDDPTSGIARRRITIPFNNVVAASEQKNLIDFDGDKPVGEFVPYLPGLIRWALSMSDADMVKCIKNTSVAVPSLNKEKVESHCDNESLMAWLEDNCIYMANGAREQIGDKRIMMSDDGIREYRGQNTQLYPNYVHYCEVNGKQPLNAQLFSNAVVDKCNNVLGLKKVDKVRDSNCRYITHIILRGGNDHLPGVLSYALLPHSDGLVTDNDRPMTAESIDYAGFGGDDEVFQKSFQEILNDDDLSSPSDNSFIPPELQISFEETPAQATNPARLSTSADTTPDTDPAQPDTTDSNEIKKHDKVRWSACPGHVEWAQPFTVLAITGNLAMLELIEKPVALCELVKV